MIEVKYWHRLCIGLQYPLKDMESIVKHVALILLTSPLFTSCVTEADKALWVETKVLFSTDGRLMSSAAAEVKEASLADDSAAQGLAPEPNLKVLQAPHGADASTGR